MLQIFPPAPQKVHFDTYQFNDRAKPVNGKNGISYDDYAGMNIRTHKPSYERRLPTPEWALNDAKLRALLVRFYERRAQITLPVGTQLERLARAQTRLVAQKPSMEATLTKLCRKYHLLRQRAASTARLEKLKIEIQNMDNRLRLVDIGPGLVLRMVQLYYRAKMDSVAVAQETGMTPWQIRVTLFRLAEEWAAMNDPAKVVARINRARLETQPISNYIRNLIGQRVGNLVVVAFHGRGHYKEALWTCVCDCGNTHIVNRGNLVSKKPTTCCPRCYHKKASIVREGRPAVTPLKDLTGQRFGRLVVLHRAPSIPGKSSARWFCKCDCGNTRVARGCALRRGDVAKCSRGCKSDAN
jgi:hypothetical protein